MAIPLLAAVGAVQALAGFIKGDKAADESKRLRASRTPFKTSQQIYDIEAATENRAATGYDAGTLEYITGQIDRASSAAYGTAKRLGGNANDLSSIFDMSLQSILKVGAENNTLNMENFSKYLGAQELLSKNLEAEWASKQGMIKDDLQAADKKRQEAATQISGGINTAISGIANDKIMKLYQERTNAMAADGSAGSLPAIDPYSPSTITANPGSSSFNPITADAINTVSNTVTPETNFARGRARIIGFDENSNPIYGR